MTRRNLPRTVLLLYLELPLHSPQSLLGVCAALAHAKGILRVVCSGPLRQFVAQVSIAGDTGPQLEKVCSKHGLQMLTNGLTPSVLLPLPARVRLASCCGGRSKLDSSSEWDARNASGSDGVS